MLVLAVIVKCDI